MIRIVQFNRANVLKSLGRFDDAEALYRLVHRDAAAVGETRTAGFAEYSLGYLRLLQGDYAAAHRLLESARAVFEELDDTHYLALTLADLTELLVEINAFERARSMGRQARDVAEKHGMRFEAGRTALLEGIAGLGLRDHGGARSCFAIARTAFRSERNPVAAATCSLYEAELDRREGRVARGRRRLRAASTRFARERLPLRRASAELRLARLEFEEHRTDAARDAMAVARRALRRVRSPWLSLQLDHLSGQLAMTERRAGAAVRLFRRAIEGVDGLRGRIGIDEFRVCFAEDKAPIYEDLVHALLERRPGDVAGAFDVVERSRSRSLVDLLAGNLDEVGSRAGPGVAKLLARADRLRAELNWHSGFDPDSVRRSRNEGRLMRSGTEIRRCEEELADVFHRIQAIDGAVGALTTGETATIEDVRAYLGDATLVEYYLGRHGALAFVITGRDARVVKLACTPAEVLDAVTRIRFQIGKHGYGDAYVRDRGEAMRHALDAQLRALAQRIWDPLGVESRRVVLVPHGPLHEVPFQALPGADGRALIDRHVFTWLPSASASRYLRPRSGRSGSGGRHAGAGARVLAVGVAEASVPEVDAEVRRVRAAFRHGRLLRGSRATRASFLAASPEADVIHVASHGVFREDDPQFSALRFADGWMSLYDFYGMRLDADLVCLSTCYSGRSRAGGGDDLVGLSRGFLHAGTRNLVVSLWPAQDASTARLMGAFYRRVAKGVVVEEALREASLELRASYPHAYHWAPFLIVGLGGAIGASCARIESRGPCRV